MSASYIKHLSMSFQSNCEKGILALFVVRLSNQNTAGPLKTYFLKISYLKF